MKAHAPGPWRLEQLPIAPDQWALCGPDTYATGVTIGSVDARHPCAEANGRLIVRAPQLLVVARSVELLYSEMQVALPLIANTQGFDLVTARVREARELIAEIEGRR